VTVCWPRAELTPLSWRRCPATPDRIGPLELAARAVNSLELVGDGLGPEVVDLLE
jgi:hypothetical protein